MNISKLINEKLINLNLQANNQREVIEKLAELLDRENKLGSREEFINAVLDREKEFSTGFGNRVAIPHCKIDSVKEASIAIGKLDKAVDWNSLDGNPVEFVIMLAVPNKEANTTHLKMLSQLASKLMSEDFRNSLLIADNCEKIIDLLSDSDEEKISVCANGQ